MKKLSINKIAVSIGLCLGYGIMFAIIPSYWIIIDKGFSFGLHFFLKHLILAAIISLLLILLILNKIKIKENFLSFRRISLLIFAIFNTTPFVIYIDCQTKWCHGLEILPFILFNCYAILAIIPIYILYKLSKNT